ncbi:MAG: hypothetical protein JNM10_12265 [Planctomycetia bacterium]|nr:hypothetical protein [Planctomycetia bacterium]
MEPVRYRRNVLDVTVLVVEVLVAATVALLGWALVLPQPRPALLLVWLPTTIALTFAAAAAWKPFTVIEVDDDEIRLRHRRRTWVFPFPIVRRVERAREEAPNALLGAIARRGTPRHHFKPALYARDGLWIRFEPEAPQRLRNRLPNDQYVWIALPDPDPTIEAAREALEAHEARTPTPSPPPRGPAPGGAR